MGSWMGKSGFQNCFLHLKTESKLAFMFDIEKNIILDLYSKLKSIKGFKREKNRGFNPI
jgi:hypothetical protein